MAGEWQRDGSGSAGGRADEALELIEPVSEPVVSLATECRTLAS